MKRTFQSEDKRKDKLFKAWIEYLTKFHSECQDAEFEEFYEGIATVSELSVNRIGFHLDDGRKLRNIPITSEISKQSCRLDMVNVVLGLRSGKWYVVDMIFVGSILDWRSKKTHITLNPLHMELLSGSTLIH